MHTGHHTTRKYPQDFFHEINPIVRIMIVADTVINSAAGLLGPIFALFIADFITGGNEMVAGISAGVYLLTKSFMQIPIANFIDRVKGERDDFIVLFCFNIVTGLIPLLYLVINTEMQLYLVQFCLGISTAFTFPTFVAMFTRHVDKNKEGTEWAIYYTFNDIAIAALSILGGYIATKFGFHTLIIIASCVSVAGSCMFWPIHNYVKRRTVMKV
jgi:MFS family permease